MYTHAAAVYESVRLRAAAGTGRATFLDSPYQRLAGALYRQGRLERAWIAAERGQGRALDDLAAREAAQSRRIFLASLEDSLRSAVDDLDARIQGLENLSDSTGQAAGLLEDARTRMHEARGAWSSLQSALATEAVVMEEDGRSLALIQRALDEKTALIGWVDVELPGAAPVAGAYVVRRSGPVRWFPLPGMETKEAAEESAALINRFRDNLMTPRSRAQQDSSLHAIEAEGHRVWAQWIAPLLPACTDADRLVVVLSGRLLGIPLEALNDETGTPLGARFAISYVPSATVYARLRQLDPIRSPGGRHRALLIGDPPFSDRHLKGMACVDAGRPGWPASPETPEQGPSQVFDESYLRSLLSGNEESLASLPRLPWTRVEVAGLSKLFPHATTLLGPDASEQALIHMARADALREYDIIHLATHALVIDDWPERSSL
ncbi:MAG: CHAT domain-containing protein, partial [Candidatus Eisenbacteria bacterium]|nr:CHAT domain-containing protein [Candidatus Eisenbacteria bacterium]